MSFLYFVGEVNKTVSGKYAAAAPSCLLLSCVAESSLVNIGLRCLPRIRWSLIDS